MSVFQTKLLLFKEACVDIDPGRGEVKSDTECLYRVDLITSRHTLVAKAELRYDLHIYFQQQHKRIQMT